MDSKSENESVGTSGSTLFSIREHELQACPETPEHLAVCLVGVMAQRLQQLGFELPDSLRLGNQLACKGTMLLSGEDVLVLFKHLLDDYERLRAERDDLRTADKLQRHELGCLSRRAASLSRALLQKDKKLADAEYRLEEAANKADQLREEARREVYKARLAASEGRRLAETAQHRERRTERELFDARQKLERTGQPVNWQSSRQPRSFQQRLRRGRGGVRSDLGSGYRGVGGSGVNGFKGSKAISPSNEPVMVSQHAVLATDLFEKIDLPPLLMQQSLAGENEPLMPRPVRNSSLPAMRQQVWYRVPPATASKTSEEVASKMSAISLADTIDVSCNSPQSSSADDFTGADAGVNLNLSATKEWRSRNR